MKDDTPDNFEKVRAYGEAASCMKKWDNFSMFEIGNVLNHYGLHGKGDLAAFEAGMAYFAQQIRNNEANRSKALNKARAEAASCQPRRED